MRTSMQLARAPTTRAGRITGSSVPINITPNTELNPYALGRMRLRKTAFWLHRETQFSNSIL